MTREDIIKFAREAGLIRPNSDWTLDRWGEYEITRFANLVATAENEACLNQVEILVEAEREACARMCELLRPSKREYDHRFYDACTASAAVIRTKGLNET